MNEGNGDELGDELRPEYEFDFSKAERGKYYGSYMAGSNIVKLDDDVASCFPNSQAVNDALRGLLELARRMPGTGPKSAVG